MRSSSSSRDAETDCVLGLRAPFDGDEIEDVASCRS